LALNCTAREGGLRGVVVMSPHWMARAARGDDQPRAPATWHDFGGFPPALYELQYPAPGAARRWARRVIANCSPRPASTPRPMSQRPLDHGAWVPLMHLLPEATVPVVQVALPARYGPAEVLAMGRALQSLRAQGVLVIGSGSMTHNLAEFFGGEREPAPYVLEFSRWIESAITTGSLQALLDYRREAPHAERAHPSDDHFLPLFFALGAGGFGEPGVKPGYLSREVMYSMLAMDSFALPAPH
jgi:4,5-DOPA dioxygenase extradiol